MPQATRLSRNNSVRLLVGCTLICAFAVQADDTNFPCHIGDANVWDGGFVLNDITISNASSTAISDWQIAVQLGTTNSSISNYWNATVTVDGGIATASNEIYNGALSIGDAATFGFQGSYSGTWNGASCSVIATTAVDDGTSGETPETDPDPVVDPDPEEDPETPDPSDDPVDETDPGEETDPIEDIDPIEGTDPGEETPPDDSSEPTEGLACVTGNVDVWPGGFVISNYAVENTAATTVDNWTLTLDFGNSVTVTNAWSQTPSVDDNLVSISGSNLTSGSQVGFGFQGAYSSESITTPPTCSVTGSAAGSEPTFEVIAGDDWLHTDGAKIVDSDGNEVWLTGANWFGFNTGSDMFDGLWAANLENAIKEMTERGINILRIPISTELMADWMNGVYPIPGSMNASVNPALDGLNSLEIFDYTLKVSQQYGLKILVDVHSASTNAAGHYENLWYDENISTETFFEAWEWFAERYKDDDTIVAFDLENEPHGVAYEDAGAARWDDSDHENNWKAVAQALGQRILVIHPHVLILVEGIETTPIEGKTYASTDKDDYYSSWWGGNLRGVRDYPIDLGDQQDQLVYSPHDYGPGVFQQAWFYEGFDMDSLYQDVWYDNWAYINDDDIAPLLVGEWGGFMDGGDNETWMYALRQFMIDNHIHHTFWCFNANSGDTGGLVENDFTTWDEAKYTLLEKALWQTEEGQYISLDHAVPLGGSAGTGISLGDLYSD